jgi:hypothetical protein
VIEENGGCDGAEREMTRFDKKVASGYSVRGVDFLRLQNIKWHFSFERDV